MGELMLAPHSDGAYAGFLNAAQTQEVDQEAIQAMHARYKSLLGDPRHKIESAFHWREVLQTMWSKNIGPTMKGHIPVLRQAELVKGWPFWLFPSVNRKQLEARNLITEGLKLRQVIYDFTALTAPPVAQKAPSPVLNYHMDTKEMTLFCNGIALEFPPDVFTDEKKTMILEMQLKQLGHTWSNTFTLSASQTLLLEAQIYADKETERLHGFPTTVENWHKLWLKRYEDSFMLDKHGKKLSGLDAEFRNIAQGRQIPAFNFLVLPQGSSSKIDNLTPNVRQSLTPQTLEVVSAGARVPAPDILVGYTTRGIGVWESSQILTYSGELVDPFIQHIQVGQFFTQPGVRMTREEANVYRTRERSLAIWDLKNAERVTLTIMDLLDAANIYSPTKELYGHGSQILTEIMLNDVKTGQRRDPADIPDFYPQQPRKGGFLDSQAKRPRISPFHGGSFSDPVGESKSAIADDAGAECTPMGVLHSSFDSTDVVGFAPHLNLWNLFVCAGLKDTAIYQISRLRAEEREQLYRAGRIDGKQQSYPGKVIPPTYFNGDDDDDDDGVAMPRGGGRTYGSGISGYRNDSKSPSNGVKPFNTYVPDTIWQTIPELNNACPRDQISDPDTKMHVEFPWTLADSKGWDFKDRKTIPFFPFPVLNATQEDGAILDYELLYSTTPEYGRVFANYVAILADIKRQLHKLFMEAEPIVGGSDRRLFIVNMLQKKAKVVGRILPWVGVGVASEVETSKLLFHDAVVMFLYEIYRYPDDALKAGQVRDNLQMFCQSLAADCQDVKAPKKFTDLAELITQNPQIYGLIQQYDTLGQDPAKDRQVLRTHAAAVLGHYQITQVTEDGLEGQLGADITIWVRDFQSQLFERKALVDAFARNVAGRNEVARLCRALQNAVMPQRWDIPQQHAIGAFIFQLITNTQHVKAALGALGSLTNAVAIGNHAIANAAAYCVPGDSQAGSRKRRRGGEEEEIAQESRASADSIEEALKRTKLRYEVFERLAEFNIVMPVGCIVARPWIDVPCGPGLCGNSQDTAEFAVIDPVLSIGSSVAEDKLYLQWKCVSAAVVYNEKNLIFAPAVSLNSGLSAGTSGGDCSFFKIEEDGDSILKGNPTKSMFCFLTPFGFEPKGSLIDLCGFFNPAAVRSSDPGATNHFCTAHIYKDVYGYKHIAENPYLLQNYINPQAASNTILARGSCWIPVNNGVGGFNIRYIPGKDAFGAMVTYESADVVTGRGSYQQLQGALPTQRLHGPADSEVRAGKVVI